MNRYPLGIIALILALAVGAAWLPAIAEAPLPQAAGPLPNPGDSLGAQGTLDARDFPYEGRLFDVWYYPLTDGWPEAVAQWLSECEAAGYAWKDARLNGYDAIVLREGERRAVLIPDYHDRIMLMAEMDLPLSVPALQFEGGLTSGTVRGALNGEPFALNAAYGSNNYTAINVENAPEDEGGSILLNLPGNRAGGVWHLEYGQDPGQNRFIYNLWLNGVEYGSSHLLGPGDYIHLTLLPVMPAGEVGFEYEAVFNYGSARLRMEGWVPVRTRDQG